MRERVYNSSYFYNMTFSLNFWLAARSELSHYQPFIRARARVGTHGYWY